jgi:hypothetical protein
MEKPACKIILVTAQHLEAGFKIARKSSRFSFYSHNWARTP